MSVCARTIKLAKMGKTSFKSKNYQSKDVLEIVHTNLCGPIGVQIYNGENSLFFWLITTLE